MGSTVRIGQIALPVLPLVVVPICIVAVLAISEGLTPEARAAVQGSALFFWLGMTQLSIALSERKGRHVLLMCAASACLLLLFVLNVCRDLLWPQLHPAVMYAVGPLLLVAYALCMVRAVRASAAEPAQKIVAETAQSSQ